MFGERCVIMKSILFVSSRLPYPLIGGERLKAYWLIKILSKHYKLHLVSLSEAQIPSEFFDWAKECGITYKIFEKKRHQYLLNALKFTLNNLPVQVNYFYFNDVQRYVNEIYENYDLIYANLIRTAQYVIKIEKPKILDMADSIAQNYLRSKNNTSSLKWKILQIFETQRLLSYEKDCIERFDKILFFNRKEAEFFDNPEKVEWVPHGVDEKLFDYNNARTEYSKWIVFFGKMDYQPNVDAAIWFVENVLPYLNKNLKFAIVGAKPTKEILDLEKKYTNVVVTGFVDDPYVILKSALCVIAPMQTGGGIQNKVLQSMALGTINIVSSLAAKPIEAQDKREFLVIDDPIEMARVIDEIYSNPGKYEYLKKNAQEYIKKSFTWSIYEEKIIKIVEELLK